MGLMAKVSAIGADAAVLAMAHTYERAVKRNLALTSHPPFTVTPSPPGNFPSLMTGRLRRSVWTDGPRGGGGVAYASVAPHMFYAGVQEYGHRMHAHGRRPMTWFNEGDWWSKRDVGVPARPYMRPTTIREVASGDLTAAAMAAFELGVWG
jgi:hypothetical protein